MVCSHSLVHQTVVIFVYFAFFFTALYCSSRSHTSKELLVHGTCLYTACKRAKNCSPIMKFRSSIASDRKHSFTWPQTVIMFMQYIDHYSFIFKANQYMVKKVWIPDAKKNRSSWENSLKGVTSVNLVCLGHLMIYYSANNDPSLLLA